MQNINSTMEDKYRRVRGWLILPISLFRPLHQVTNFLYLTAHVMFNDINTKQHNKSIHWSHLHQNIFFIFSIVKMFFNLEFHQLAPYLVYTDANQGGFSAYYLI